MTQHTDNNATVTVYDTEQNELTLPIPAGWSVMEVLREQRLLAGECGAQMLCATCHVYVDPAHADALPALSDDEDIMLDNLNTRQPTSRLSCQLRLAPGENIRLQVAPAD